MMEIVLSYIEHVSFHLSSHTACVLNDLENSSQFVFSRILNFRIEKQRKTLIKISLIVEIFHAIKAKFFRDFSHTSYSLDRFDTTKTKPSEAEKIFFLSLNIKLQHPHTHILAKIHFKSPTMSEGRVEFLHNVQ